MSKKQKTAEQRYYTVGQIGERGSRFKARDPREAVRLWCEFQGYKFWEEHESKITVWTDNYGETGSNFQKWIVDASQPPAWIINPATGNKRETKK